jgi:hypothetical protein
MQDTGYVVKRTDVDEGKVSYEAVYRFPSKHYHDLWAILYPNAAIRDWSSFEVTNG